MIIGNLKFPLITFADDDPSDFDNLFKRTMPWLGDDICMKDPQALPGLSLVQWMNMQQNPALSSSLQPNYMQSLSGSVLQNLPGADIARQLGFSTPQISQSNNVAFNSQRLLQTAQQLDHLQKIPSTSSPLGAVMQPQQQLNDITQQPRQSLGNQTLPQSQVQTQVLHPQNLVQTNNILQQQQPSIQNHQLHRSIPHNLPQPQQQQTIMGQNQQQNLIQSPMSDNVNQQLQMSDNHIQLQLLQKLQQQQQTLLAQQSVMQQPAQLTQIQDQQRQLLDAAQNFSRSLTPSQVLEIPPILQNSLPEANSIPHQMTKINGQTNIQFSHLSQQPKLQQQQPGMLSEISGHVGLPPTPTTNHLSVAGSSILTGAAGAGQSVITDDIPSCSTSPSTNNCANALPHVNSRIHRNTTIGDDMAQSAATILSPSALEILSSNASLVKDLQPKSEVKPSLNISKNQNQGNFAPQTYLNGGAAQTDYLDTSSSTTSVSLSRNDTHMHHNNNPLSYNLQSMLFRDSSQDGEIQADARCNGPYGNNIDGQLGMPPNPDSPLTKGAVGLGKDLSNNFSSGGMLSNYDNNRDAQQELSSSMVSQTFGVPDMTFNSIDPTINDSSFLNRGTWAPPPPQPPQFQRMRTYTKVIIIIFILCLRWWISYLLFVLNYCYKLFLVHTGVQTWSCG